MKHILAHKYIPMHFSVGLSFLGLLLLSLVSSTIIGVPHRAQAACAVPSTNYGAATATVTVPSDATYKIWSRIMAPDASNNSYRLEIDGGTCYAVGNSAITANSWTWVDYQNGTTASKTTARLAAGQHTVKMIGVDQVSKLTACYLWQTRAVYQPGWGTIV